LYLTFRANKLWRECLSPEAAMGPKLTTRAILKRIAARAVGCVKSQRECWRALPKFGVPIVPIAPKVPRVRSLVHVGRLIERPIDRVLGILLPCVERPLAGFCEGDGRTANAAGRLRRRRWIARLLEQGVAERLAPGQHQGRTIAGRRDREADP